MQDKQVWREKRICHHGRGDVVTRRSKVDVKRIGRPTRCQSVFLENCRGNLFSPGTAWPCTPRLARTDKRFSRLEKGTAPGQSEQFVSLNVNSRIYWRQIGSRRLRRELFDRANDDYKLLLPGRCAFNNWHRLNIALPIEWNSSIRCQEKSTFRATCFTNVVWRIKSKSSKIVDRGLFYLLNITTDTYKVVYRNEEKGCNRRSGFTRKQIILRLLARRASQTVW